MQVTFIDAEVPEPGKLQEVASGIFWLRMPLPFDLDHINLYLLEDNQNGQDGFALIDTGIGTKKTEELWDALLDFLAKPITKVIVTHMHPDHIGMAGYLVDNLTMEDFGVEIYFVKRVGFGRFVFGVPPRLVPGKIPSPRFLRNGENIVCANDDEVHLMRLAVVSDQ